MGREEVKVGARRVERIKAQYEEEGYFVLDNKDFYGSGVDIMVILKSGKVKKVLEVTNYRSPTQYISNDRFDRYIKELNRFDVLPDIEKELVISYDSNISVEQWDALRRNNINLTVVGRQD